MENNKQRNHMRNNQAVLTMRKPIKEASVKVEKGMMVMKTMMSRVWDQVMCSGYGHDAQGMSCVDNEETNQWGECQGEEGDDGYEDNGSTSNSLAADHGELENPNHESEFYNQNHQVQQPAINSAEAESSTSTSSGDGE